MLEYVTLANTGETIKNDFILCRRTHENITLDTSVGKEKRLSEFNSFIEIINNQHLPFFLTEYLSPTLNIFMIEKCLEDYRVINFPNYPSRLSCSFFSKDNLAFNSKPHKGVSLEGSTIIKCDMEIINFLRSYPAYITAQVLEAYWKGIPLNQLNGIPLGYGTTWEYLVEGKHNVQYI